MTIALKIDYSIQEPFLLPHNVEIATKIKRGRIIREINGNGIFFVDKSRRLQGRISNETFSNEIGRSRIAIAIFCELIYRDLSSLQFGARSNSQTSALTPTIKASSRFRYQIPQRVRFCDVYFAGERTTWVLEILNTLHTLSRRALPCCNT